MSRRKRPSSGTDVCEFIERFCATPEGRLAGQPIKLVGFQKPFIADLYGNPHGTRRGLLSTGKKCGKGLAIDTPVATPRGWSTMGALKVDDQVFDERGHACRVTYVSPVHVGLRCWRLRFADGSEIVADEQHQWLTMHRVGHGWRWSVVATPEIGAQVYVVQRSNGALVRQHKVAVAAAPDTPEAALPVPP